jgi:hypothetical protein
MARKRLLYPRFIADQQELELIVACARKRRALDHDAHALIAAHRVNGDTRQCHGRLVSLSRTLETDSDDLTAIIVAACTAQHVRTLQFAAVAAFVESIDLQRIVAAAHTAA